MARKKIKKQPNILTNEGLVIAILNALQLEFNHHDKIPGADEAGVSMFSLPFTLDGDPDDEVSFIVYIFCHEHPTLLRMYGMLYKIEDEANIPDITRIINGINADHMLDGFVDLTEKHRMIRLRSSLRSEASSLPVKSTQESLSEFFDVCANIRLIIKTAIESGKEFPENLELGKSALTEKTNWKPSTLL
ncbi:hypothetical protein [Burkholderia cepacia]|uniref:hypothetical protein n=1 Tax=Burkholderia cepacia TaxID=292 RepID=UPI002FE38DEF